jgi:hypothetical protein
MHGACACFFFFFLKLSSLVSETPLSLSELRQNKQTLSILLLPSTWRLLDSNPRLLNSQFGAVHLSQHYTHSKPQLISASNHLLFNTLSPLLPLLSPSFFHFLFISFFLAVVHGWPCHGQFTDLACQRWGTYHLLSFTC